MVPKKVSIVIPVLNSHEVLRRQFLHFQRIGIPENVEIIIVDDGSVPELEYNGDLPVRIIRTHDYRPWTWALARNRGAREAAGEYLLMTDIDHIIPRETIDAVREFNGQKIQIKREFGVLLEDGSFTQDLGVLVKYGFPSERYYSKGLTIPPLPNNFAMKKSIFWELGGYREDLVEREYPQGEDRLFKKAWHLWETSGKGKVSNILAKMYMFPNGYLCNGDVNFNPFGLFHNLSRATKHNMIYKEMIKVNG